MSVLLSIKVTPNAKVDHFWCDEQGIWRVKIKALPVDGKANEYLIHYLASIFKVPKSKIQLIKGATNQYKKVALDIEESDLQFILNKFLT